MLLGCRSSSKVRSMSLKAFHLVFIAASILLSVFYGVWAVYRHLVESRLLLLGSGMFSFVLAVGLIVYGGAMMKKLRSSSYL